jgi:S-adenosylmethionine/arginine decarboxylase-like enzyme
MMGPYVKYSHMVGNRGITGAAIIETSHIVMHVWDEPEPRTSCSLMYTLAVSLILKQYVIK